MELLGHNHGAGGISPHIIYFLVRFFEENNIMTNQFIPLQITKSVGVTINKNECQVYRLHLQFNPKPRK